ncbi:hypothetical protein [Breoghania sp. L-A4]|uniref:hypothetical protein n=1 Tax=Breoghania sp. L-A4 TaxID=2304600 RepID=UPI000E35B873|nr:hypothetical protein [Breoghania sp. L-A4]AXS41287.1 hypothetical protein D1F64_16225 [Breoghania sp. L-A4]
MARKPNYNFERMERDRAKAAKKAERLAAKQEKADAKRDPDGSDAPSETTDGQDTSEASSD